MSGIRIMAVSSDIAWKFALVIIACALLQVVSSNTLVCLRTNNQLCIQGVEKVTSFNTKYEAFLGIPYAKPPMGQLRFTNPVPNDPWTGIYDATQPKPSCIQFSDVQPVGIVIGSEDCLYLNVYRPKNASSNLPVMVYIHGGGFVYGSADPSVSGPGRFMDDQEVILVTVSYRLGALGFLSTGDSVAPGNFGFKDQSMAIRWVKKYIQRFGGNNQLITVFGEGTGAVATQLHMMSPLSRGNFSRAILMSGSALAVFYRPNPDPLRIAKVQVGLLGNILHDTLTSSEVITFLRGVPAAQLVSSINDLARAVDPYNSVAVYRPVIEQYVEGQSFLSASPTTLWAAGEYEQIPWMAGHVPNEWAIFVKKIQRITSNPSQWLGLVAQGIGSITSSIGLSNSAAPALVQRFFSAINLLSPSITQVVDITYNMVGEVQYEYPLLRSVIQHLQHDDPLKAPVSVYFMNFTGPYSVSSLIAPGSTYPIVHSDDLQYVLSRPGLFPEFAFGSPGFLMSKKMVKLFAEFALTGHALSSYLGTCSSLTDCQQIELSNGQSGFDPVQIQLTNAIDSDVLTFWDPVYNMP